MGTSGCFGCCLRWATALLGSASLVACATTQGRFVALDQTYPPRAEECDPPMVAAGFPDRPFVRIARLDVHLEKTHFVPSDLGDALPELKRQACLAGADAIIEVQERRGQVLETRTYHVTATGIKFTK